MAGYTLKYSITYIKTKSLIDVKFNEVLRAFFNANYFLINSSKASASASPLNPFCTIIPSASTR